MEMLMRCENSKKSFHDLRKYLVLKINKYNCLVSDKDGHYAAGSTESCICGSTESCSCGYSRNYGLDLIFIEYVNVRHRVVTQHYDFVHFFVMSTFLLRIAFCLDLYMVARPSIHL